MFTMNSPNRIFQLGVVKVIQSTRILYIYSTSCTFCTTILTIFILIKNGESRNHADPVI